VICVTPENVGSLWLLFEAGALIRCDVEVALFPVLLDLPPAAMEGPLALVQATVIERDPSAIKRETFDLLSRIVNHVNQFRQDPIWISLQPPRPDDVEFRHPRVLCGSTQLILKSPNRYAVN
jgi:hypothetical protein